MQRWYVHIDIREFAHCTSILAWTSVQNCRQGTAIFSPFSCPHLRYTHMYIRYLVAVWHQMHANLVYLLPGLKKIYKKKKKKKTTDPCFVSSEPFSLSLNWPKYVRSGNYTTKKLHKCMRTLWVKLDLSNSLEHKKIS